MIDRVDTSFERGFGAFARVAVRRDLAADMQGQFGTRAGRISLIALSTDFGPVTAHAFQIVFSVHNVTFGVALGLGSAAGVRVGNAVGEGTPALASARKVAARS